MTKLDEVVDIADLFAAIDAGHIRVQHHPELPYVIYNYTEACQYARAWNRTTLACRGLVVNLDTAEVLARPFGKFFNHGDEAHDLLDLGAPVHVTDKADGSLGILYPTPEGGWMVATRGSFESDQARHAMQVWAQRYRGVVVPDGVTLLFEIVYPANRIVLDYGDLDDLVLLGGIDIASGRTVDIDPAAIGWPGPVTEVMPHRTLADALAAEPRPNAEGLVVRFLDTDQRVKIKQADYVELHAIVTRLNARTVWEPLAAGKGVGALLDSVPDEFHGFVRDVAEKLTAQVENRAAAIEAAYDEIRNSLPAACTRKDYALTIKDHPERAALFCCLDGKDYRRYLWREVKPSAMWTPTGRVYTEDAA